MKHIVLVGCGDIAARHAKTLQGLAQVSFCSRELTKAQQYQNKYRGHKAYADFDKVLEDASVDGVVLCSPPAQHEQQLLACIDAGKHTLVEKPLTISSESLKRIEEAVSQTTGLCLMVAENYYYKPSLRILQQWMAKPGFGKLQKVVLRKMFTQKSQGWKSQYGALLEGGIHFVALLSALTNQQTPTEVRGEIVKIDDQPERTSHLYASYPNNVEAQIHYSWETPQATFGLFEHSVLIGEHDTIIFESNGLYMRSGWKFRLGPFADIGGSQTMMRDFIQNMDTANPAPISSIRAAGRDLRIIFAAYGWL